MSYTIDDDVDYEGSNYGTKLYALLVLYSLLRITYLELKRREDYRM